VSEKKLFVKLVRGPESRDLLVKYPKEFLLLSLIALRSRWSPTDLPLRLEPGEAMVGKGDFEKWGFSAKQYRTALERLKKWHFVDTRRAPCGTIAKLINSGIYDLNLEARGNERAQEGPAAGHEMTPNEEEKNEEQRNKNNFENKLKTNPLVHLPLPSASQMDGKMNRAPAALPGATHKKNQDQVGVQEVCCVKDYDRIIRYYKRLASEPGSDSDQCAPAEESTAGLSPDTSGNQRASAGAAGRFRAFAEAREDEPYLCLVGSSKVSIAGEAKKLEAEHAKNVA